MTSLFPPFTRRASFRKQPFFYEAGRGVYYKSLGYSSPALNLNFTTGTLDSRITFSRGSNGTLVDSTGKITYAPANLLLRSQEFDNASWDKLKGGTGSTPTVSQDTVAAPDGTLTADTIVFNKGSGTTANDYSIVRNTVGITTSALSYVSSFYIRAASNCNVTAYLNTGSVVYNNIAVTTSWQRISFVTAAPAGAAVYLSIGLIGNDSTGNSSATVYLWGAQLEPVTYQTTPSTYVATTASAYYGPRFDYDPVTLACKGLLIEEQRTNLVTNSSAFGSWTNNSVTVNSDVAVAPDGTTTADELVRTGATSDSRYQTVTFTGDGTKSVSIFVKYNTSPTFTLFLYDSTATTNKMLIEFAFTGGVPASSTVSSGSVEAIENFGNGWYRVKVLCPSVVAANTNVLYVYPARTGSSNGQKTTFWGAQAENGSFATSYIPTTTATVTRSADVASMTGSNFSSWYNQSAGTFVGVGDVLDTSGFKLLFNARNGGANADQVSMYQVSAAPAFEVVTSSVAKTLLPSGVISANVQFKLAGAYQANDYAASYNSGTIATNTTASPPTNLNNCWIGAQAGVNQLNGHVASIQYYNKRLPNALLRAYTA